RSFWIGTRRVLRTDEVAVSRSTSTVGARLDSSSAKLTANVVLPTPPLPDATGRIRRGMGTGTLPRPLPPRHCRGAPGLAPTGRTHQEVSVIAKRSVTLPLALALAAAPALAGVDPHSFSRPDQVAVTHIELDLTVDFELQRLAGSAVLSLDRRQPDATELVL